MTHLRNGIWLAVATSLAMILGTIVLPSEAVAADASYDRVGFVYDYDANSVHGRVVARAPVEQLGLAPSASGEISASGSIEVSRRSNPKRVAPNSADDLLDQARAARNATADEVGSRTATVTGGYDPATGRVVSGCSSNPVGCAELDVVRQLDIDPADVRFTEAIRPRNGQQAPICHLCQEQFSPSQFPPSVESLPNGPWGPR